MIRRPLAVVVAAAALAVIPLSTADAQSATVTITGPAGGASLSGKSATITASADTLCYSFKLMADGHQVAYDDNPHMGATATTSDLAFDPTGLSNGSHQFSAIADCNQYDPTTGNHETQISSQAVAYTVSNNTPTITITSPVDHATTSGSSVTVTADVAAHDGASITEVDFYLDSDDMGYIDSDNLAPYSSTINTSTMYGEHTVWAVAHDSHGLIGTSAKTTFTVGNDAPGVYWTAPATGSTLTGTAVTLTSRNHLIACNSGHLEVDGHWSVDATSTYGSDTQTYQINSANLTDGDHQFVAVADYCYDRTGTYRSAPMALTVRNTPPAVTITSPSEGAQLSAPTVFRVDARPDPAGTQTITKVEVYVDEDPAGADAYPAATDNLAPFEWNLDPAGYTIGAHTFYAVAYDSAGLVQTSTARTVQVHRYTTKISQSSALIRRGANVTLAARALDGSASLRGKTITVYVRGPGTTAYHLSRRIVSDSTGLARTTFVRPTADFRWYVTYSAAGRTIRSAVGLVQVR